MAIVQAIVDLDVPVVVLTATQDSFAIMDGHQALNTAGLPTLARPERVPFVAEQQWPVINDWTARRAREPRAWARSLRDRDHGVFPEDAYASWLAPAAARALAIAAKLDLRLVVGVGDPYVGFEVAAAVHGAFGTPFVLDDRESFLFDLQLGRPGPFFAQRLPRYREYLSGCREYWFSTQLAADLHRTVDGLHSHSHKIHLVEMVAAPAEETSNAVVASHPAPRFNVIGPALRRVVVTP